MKYAELLNVKGSETRGVAPQRNAEKGPKIVLLAREVLADCVRGSSDSRKEKALGLLCAEIEKRGGKLATVTLSDGTQRVEGEVRVPAGSDKVERRVRTASGTETVSYPKGIDENVVQAGVGFGMGALAVSYRVDGKGNAEYVIRTNGKRSCVEENLLNVAMALAGAAQIVEDMLKPAPCVSNVVKLRMAA